MDQAQQKRLNKQLQDAAENGDMAPMSTLLKQGAEINCRHCDDGCKKTPLMWAAEKGLRAMLLFLLEHGADITLRNGDDKTALELALENKKYDIAETLQEHTPGKNPNKIAFYDQSDDHVRQDIYDFTMRERVTLIREGGRYGEIKTTVITGFSAIEDQSDESMLRKAFNEHKARGGTTDEHTIFPNRIYKPAPRNRPS